MRVRSDGNIERPAPEAVTLGAMTWFQEDGFRLRTAETSDTDALFGYLNHSDVYSDRQFDLDGPWPLGRAEIERHLSQSSDTGRTFVVETGGAIVGHVAVDWWWDALQPWVGVVIAPQHRRHGHGRRAAAMVLGFLFDQTPAHVVIAQAGTATVSSAAAIAAAKSTTRGPQREATSSSSSITPLPVTALRASQPGRSATVSADWPPKLVSARKITSGSASTMVYCT